MSLAPDQIFDQFEELIQNFFGSLKGKDQKYEQYFSTLENPENDPNNTINYHPLREEIKSMMFKLELTKSLFLGGGAKKYELMNQHSSLLEQNSLIQKSQNSNQDSIIRDGKVCNECIQSQNYISCLLEKLLNNQQDFKNKPKETQVKIITQFENLPKGINDEQQNNINKKTFIQKKIEEVFKQNGINESNIAQISDIPYKEQEVSQFSVLQNLDQKKIIYNEKKKIYQPEKCQALCFNKDDTLIATAQHKEIVLWTFQEGTMNKINGNMMRHSGEISCLLFDTDSDSLISGGGDSDCQIKIWKCTEQMKWELQETQKLEGGVKVMLLNKKRDKLFIGTQKGQIAIFEVNFTTFTLGQPKIQKIDEKSTPIFGLSLNEDEKYLVSCGMDCYLRLFSIGQEIIEIYKEKCSSYGMRIKFIDNSSFVLVQQDGKLIYSKIEKKNIKQYFDFDLESGENDHCYTPIWYDPKRKLLIIKHNTSIHFLILQDGGLVRIGQKLDKKYYFLFATASNSGKFFVTWVDKHEKQSNQGEELDRYQKYPTSSCKNQGKYQIYELYIIQY